METKLLDIVATKSRKSFPILGWGIMWWTGKGFSHVARAVEIRDWGKRYFQASEGKVNYEYEKYFLKKHEIVHKYHLCYVYLDHRIERISKIFHRYFSI